MSPGHIFVFSVGVYMSSTTARVAALFLTGLIVSAVSAEARDWVTTGWKEIPVREYPAAAAPLVGTVKGGVYPDLTGKCTRELNLQQIGYMDGLHQRLLVNSRWCEIATPAHGWIFGGFLKPW